MNVLTKGIVDYYTADVMASTFTAIYFCEAPSDAVYPYVIFSYVNIAHDLTFTERFEEAVVQFDIYTDEASGEVLGDLYDLLIGDEDLDTGFDYAEFAVSGYNLLGFERENSIPHKYFLENKTVWHYMVQYRCLLKKS